MASSLFDLSGKTAVVTGGTRGIGRAIAIGLAEAGADIIIVKVNTGEHPRIDILVNAAGMIRRSDAVDVTDQDYDEVIQVNLGATFTLCREMGKYWIKNDMPGKIINIASVCTYFGSVRVPAYSISKGGIGQLTKALSNEWASKGINVNVIAPGYIATDLTQGLRSGGEEEQNLKVITSRIPAGRWGTPNDMKGPAVFLASAASAYVNGELLTYGRLMADTVVVDLA
ncbi:uncharacterized protein GIQ15_04140 [Arthroderma uncinatum]|uniref:uncharacterized protein n=1 Tax=Arthroderma uncinatum TaxID=74035 RepID=UPI00144AC902|nr:uncharacterized protein GIQ15_04140 [Arthroderma uncinatum]KAF3481381.1 hypothetical protein GIQ15_04140 [Arthroderma uncinatum]